MQKPISTLCVALSLLAYAMSAIAQVKISGNITSTDNKPIAGANVLLLKSTDSTLVKGTISSSSGNFFIENIKPGKYNLQVTSTGYKQFYSELMELNNKDVNAGNILLRREEKEMDEVTVVSRKPLFEQKIDRMVINVKNSITSAGGTALEVLQKSPGVIVNLQSNSISLSGKEGVVIMINGKISRLPVEAVIQMLSGMNASNIERIELITTPPANFDAEGNAGFINIIMVNNPNKGLNGSVSLTAAYGHGWLPASAFNFNYRNKKINLFGDYSFTWRNQPQNWYFFHSSYIQNVLTENSSVTQRDPKDGQQNYRLGMDIQVTPKTIIGFLAGGYASKWDMKADNSLVISKNGVPDSSVLIANKELNQWKHYMGNVNFSHQFTEGEKLTADLDYLYYKDNNPNDYTNRYFNSSGAELEEVLTRSSKLTPLSFWVAKTDYTKKIGKKVNLEAGAKLAISKFTNDVAVETYQQNAWVKDPELTSKYRLKENIAAAYTSFSIDASEKTGLKLGLRYEYTTSNLGSALQPNIIDRKYGRLFPTIFISHKLDDKNSFNVSYGRRITRPTFRDMAPFVIFIDPFTFFSGNSALQPAFSNIYKIDYLFKGFIFSASYTKEDGSIANFQPKITASNKQVLAAENLDNIKTFNVSISLPFTITKWWNMQNNLQGNWQQINATFSKGPFRLEQANYGINTTQNFNLPKDYSIELSGFYQSKGVFGSYITKPFGIANFGIQKKFKDNKSRLRFAVEDLFNTTVFKVYADIPSENIYTSAKLRFAYRTYKITYTYNFGKTILKSKRDRSTASDEEQGRVK